MGIDPNKLPDRIKQALAVGAIHATGGAAKPLPKWATSGRRCASRIRERLKRDLGVAPGPVGAEEVASWTYEGDMMGAPRMTQRDRWAKRERVERYHAIRDGLRASVPEHIRGRLGECYRLDWVVWVPMPETWSKRKRAAMAGGWHRAGRLDRDNLDKTVLDALFEQDGGVACGLIGKRWAVDGVSKVDFVAHFLPAAGAVGATETTEKTEETEQ